MKKITRIILIIFLTSVINTAQPYLYYSGKTIDSISYSCEIMRKSLSTGTKELFMHNGNYEIYEDATQNWVGTGRMHHNTGEYRIYNAYDTTNVLNLDDYADLEQILFAKKINKLVLFSSNANGPAIRVFDIINKNEICSYPIPKICNLNLEAFFSKAEDIVYFSEGAKNEQVNCYSVNTNMVIKKIALSSLGYPGADAYDFHRGRNGIGIILSIFHNQTNDRIFNTYDFNKNQKSSYILIHGSAKPFIIGDGKYLALVERTFNTQSRIPYRNTGYVYIYNLGTTQLVHTFKFPENRGILFFDNYQDFIFPPYEADPSLPRRINVDSLIQQTSGAKVKLLNSTGSKLLGGSLQYYEGSWKDAVNNNDGTFIVTTSQKTLSLRMNYAYGSQTKSNVTVGADTVVFQTVNTQVKLLDSKGSILDTGRVQYYSGAWRDFGATTNGVAVKELLPNNYSFRMNYAFASKDKSQDVGTNNTVVFQTVPATVQLKNSSGNLMDAGTVQYYSGAWRDFGATTNGVAVKELLPNNYSFRMNYLFGSRDKAQDISTNNVVVFQTVPATVQLRNSGGELMPAPLGDAGTVQYYSGAWRDFGSTTNGVAVKELLPNNYSFRMNYAFASKDKAQDISTNNVVVFQTVSATVQLKNSNGELMDAGTVQYYSGAWRAFGNTINGVAVKELLPNNYSFRMNYMFGSRDKAQDISTNNTVVFQTVPATVQLKNSSSELMPAPLGDAGTVQYYSGAWRDFGATTNGVAVKELLPNNYSFRMNYAFASKDKAQDISTNNVVIFQTVPAMVQLKNSNGSLMDAGTVQYYSGAWREFGSTTNGVTVKELLPNNYSFRMTHEFVSLDKTQNTETNNVIVFNTVLCNVNVLDAQNQPVNNAAVSYYSGAWRSIGATLNGTISKELLPVNLSFRAVSGTKQLDKTQNIGTNKNVEIKLP